MLPVGAGGLSYGDSIDGYAWEELSVLIDGNRRVGKRILTEVFYVAKIKDGKLVSLNDEEIAKYTVKFWEPRTFTQDEIVDSWFDGLFCAL